MNLSVNPEDRFWKDSPDPKEPARSSGFLRYVLAFFFLGLGLVGGWKLFDYLRGPSLSADTLPLIKADEVPYKIKAVDQSVPGIPHQDKQVYDRLGTSQKGEDLSPVVEHILPEPEPPAVVEMTERYAPQEINFESSLAPVESPPAPASSEISSIEDLIEANAVATTETPLPLSKGNIFIQLGSLKSQELAELEWARALEKTDVLRKFDPTIQRVDLGEDQGIYYRLRTGPFETLESAQKACSALREEKVNCFVVKTSAP